MDITRTFIVNGERKTVTAPAQERLLWVLRDRLGITGPKYGCGLAVCQSCTSHLDGEAFNPCGMPFEDLRPANEQADDRALSTVVTIEGLAATKPNEAGLHPVQQVWIEDDVAQCGFCQPGQIMAAVDLIERKLDRLQAGAVDPDLITEADLDALKNVCRCGTYPRVRDAIKRAAKVMQGIPTEPSVTPPAEPPVA